MGEWRSGGLERAREGTGGRAKEEGRRGRVVLMEYVLGLLFQAKG